MPIRPAYRAIYDQLKERVTSGTYALGDTIPREHDLADAFSVSRNTVRAALALLESEGLIRRTRNMGTTVIATAPSLKIKFNFGSTAGIRNLTRSTRFEVLWRGHRRIPDTAPVSAATRWAFLQGVRVDVANGHRVGLNEIYIRPDLEAVLTGVNVREDLVWPRFATLFDEPVETMSISLKPIVVPSAAAKLLACRIGDPAMQLLEVLRTSQGDVVEFIQSTYLASHFDFAVEIRVQADDYFHR